MPDGDRQRVRQRLRTCVVQQHGEASSACSSYFPSELPLHKQDYEARPWRSNETFVKRRTVVSNLKHNSRKKFGSPMHVAFRAQLDLRSCNAARLAFAVSCPESKTRRASPVGLKKITGKLLDYLWRPMPASHCGLASNAAFITGHR